VRACCQIAMKKYHQLLRFNAAHEKDPYITGFLFGQLEMTVHTAVCLAGIGDIEEALKTLSKAYKLAAPNGLDMPFIECGNNMRSLTLQAQKQGNTEIPMEWLKDIHSRASTYVKRAAHVRLYASAASGQAGEESRLTERERGILMDYSKGLSRAEIASARGLSVGAVKLALRIICDKLGAQTGLDAIRIATVRSLL